MSDKNNETRRLKATHVYWVDPYGNHASAGLAPGIESDVGVVSVFINGGGFFFNVPSLPLAIAREFAAALTQAIALVEQHQQESGA